MIEFLNSWMKSYISEQLSDLINLTKLENKNKYLRALAFQLYENNGILKRDVVNDVVKLISKEERKQFRNLGIKIGRYHIFLPKMLKPKAVSLRILLWSFHNSEQNNNVIPKSGLNFLIDTKGTFNSKFLLLCGFEKFKKFLYKSGYFGKIFLKNN